MMEKLFGTDGIRGKANEYPMTPETALKIGQAAALFFKEKNRKEYPLFVIGRDTRISGSMIESALIAGICSVGGHAYRAGVLPTPGVAYMTLHHKADAGIVVSASHNPFYDNGIKFFNGKGFKLSDALEAEMEALITDENRAHRLSTHHGIGNTHTLTDAPETYQSFLLKTLNPSNANLLKGYKIALDCGNGATSHIAPSIFSRLGAEIFPMAVTPNGININDNCGSQYPEVLAQNVLSTDSDIGLAFDGDGDRLVAVDETGAILTGDQLIAIFARSLKEKNLLKNRTVVSTVMSNIGLEKALLHMGIKHVTSAVGDRYVMEEMIASGSVLGGEDSGHIIFFNHHTTGDGMLAALQLVQTAICEAKPMSELAGIMTVYPQILLNVAVTRKPDLHEIPALLDGIAAVEKKLGDKGRVLVRYSGTQPMCRIMVEAPEKRIADKFSVQLADIIKESIGA